MEYSDTEYYNYALSKNKDYYNPYLEEILHKIFPEIIGVAQRLKAVNFLEGFFMEVGSPRERIKEYTKSNPELGLHEKVIEDYLNRRYKLFEDLEVLSISIPLPPLMTIDDYSEIVAKIEIIDFIYSLFTLVANGSQSTVQKFFIAVRNHESKSDFPKSKIQEALLANNINPLKISALRYGSPAQFDLLGIGNVIGAISDVYKDISWRGSYQKQIAELEVKSKQIENQKEKIVIEQQKAALVSQKIEIEKASVDLALKKIEVLEKLNNLSLSDEDKKTMAALLSPKLLALISPEQ